MATIEDLFSFPPSVARVRVIANAALSEDGVDGTDRCPRYFEALDRALVLEPPPFGTLEYTQVYESLASNPLWLGTSLITNAEREGDGATRLWSLAACASNMHHKVSLKRHACDESRHATIYLKLLDLVLPGIVSPEFRAELKQLSPGFTPSRELAPIPGSPYAKEPTIDDFLQMNIAEIRTTIHHMMQRPALAVHCPTPNRPKVAKLLDSLLRDELAHVSYSAKLIEEIAEQADAPVKLAQLFVRRLHDFNSITNQELGGNVFDCSKACCAKRPWCRSKVGTASREPELFSLAPTLKG